MTRVLVVGYDPNSADFTGPALPRGIDAEKIRRREAGAPRSACRSACFTHTALSRRQGPCRAEQKDFDG